ncbi:MAG: ribosome small subunit-dependent GTPase A [Firmicutes bacterium]|nr:ribosome small subunit-dependent GTPase A [Bacillota bacterium]
MTEGIIIKGVGGFYYVSNADGVYECRARGIFRKENIKPMVGDKVKIQIIDEKKKKGNVEVIEERKNSLIRPRVANVDQAVIVFAAASPNINLDLLDRFIVLVEEQELEAVICINKTDLDKEENYKAIAETYRRAGYEVICLCAQKGENVDLLKEALRDKISVFAGPSGVGKSSLINCLNPDFKLETGEVSAKIERGRHTTRHAQLMELFENSFIVDSPGFSSLFLDHIDKDKLKYYFREFENYNDTCYYNGCSHTHEPDCSVKSKVGEEISQERYDRYVSLYNELAEERKK